MNETRDHEAYWNELIDEKAAAEFRHQSVRTLQDYRSRGGGPRYYRLSPKCIRYRRIDLKEDAEARAATSTAEYASEPTAAP